MACIEQNNDAKEIFKVIKEVANDNHISLGSITNIVLSANGQSCNGCPRFFEVKIYYRYYFPCPYDNYPGN